MILSDAFLLPVSSQLQTQQVMTHKLCHK